MTADFKSFAAAARAADRWAREDPGTEYAVYAHEPFGKLEGFNVEKRHHGSSYAHVAYTPAEESTSGTPGHLLTNPTAESHTRTTTG